MNGVTRPRIAVLYSEDVAGEHLTDYVDALTDAGADAECLSPANSPDLVAQLGEYDGVVLTGGVDIDPALYGETPHPKLGRIDCPRDEFERAALRAALDRDLAVLGICRGHQFLNVALGGRLLQHIEAGNHRPIHSESQFHEVKLGPGTLLQRLYEQERLQVNSRHHQAVTPDRLASGLEVLASSDDGLIEAMRVIDHRFAVSVQWHPERKELAEASAPLFQAFVAAARRQEATR